MESYVAPGARIPGARVAVSSSGKKARDTTADEQNFHKALLFEPLTLSSGVRVKNRVVLSPMYEGGSGDRDGTRFKWIV